MAAFCAVEIKSGYQFFIIADILEVFYDSFYARNGKIVWDATLCVRKAEFVDF